MSKISGLFYLLLVVATGSGLVACGGGGGSQLPARVTYSDQVGLGQVQNYMDAEWLYQNYLGEYGLPSEMKPAIMPAIQMLANGFALQFKRGDDVSSNIAHFHEQFTMFAASGQVTQSVQSMLEAPPVLPAPPIDPVNPPVNPLETAENFIPPPMTEEVKQAVAESLARDAALRAEILRIAKEYELPYTISGRDEQWFIYTPAMKHGGKGGGSAPAPVSVHPNLNRWGWTMGDLIWSNGELGTGIPGHVGLVENGYGYPSITDANTPGVVRYPDMNKWAAQYTEVRAYSPKLDWDWSIYDCLLGSGWLCGPSYLHGTYKRKTAVDYANLQVGKPYSWDFVNPWHTSKFYCSSLVWRSYLKGSYLLFPAYSGFGIITPADITNTSTTLYFNVSRL